MTFLLDTNAVIYLINGRLAMALPAGQSKGRTRTVTKLLILREHALAVETLAPR